ncbi:hypothetical protein DHD05_20585 [Arenibacter sp. N53]|nr:hypothetical protein [Arenibacter sp. N53]
MKVNWQSIFLGIILIFWRKLKKLISIYVFNRLNNKNIPYLQYKSGRMPLDMSKVINPSVLHMNLAVISINLMLSTIIKI